MDDDRAAVDERARGHIVFIAGVRVWARRLVEDCPRAVEVLVPTRRGEPEASHPVIGHALGGGDLEPEIALVIVGMVFSHTSRSARVHQTVERNGYAADVRVRARERAG